MVFEVLRDYFREIRKIPVLTAEEEKELAIRAQKGDESAKVKLIRSNLRLVVKIARKYERLGLPLPDLIEEGNIGLIKALNRFNPRLGYRFSTYASWWIRQHVIRAIANQARVVRIPVYMSELLHKMRKASERLMHKYGRKPRDEELAKALKISLEKVQQLKRVAHRSTSLDRQISEDAEAEFIDLLQDEEIEAVDELVNLFKKEEVEELLYMMDERSREIIEMRFGLRTGIPKTLAEVARNFGVTRERVRQIEKEALEKMREVLLSNQPIKIETKQTTQAHSFLKKGRKPEVRRKRKTRTKGRKSKREKKVEAASGKKPGVKKSKRAKGEKSRKGQRSKRMRAVRKKKSRRKK